MIEILRFAKYSFEMVSLSLHFDSAGNLLRLISKYLLRFASDFLVEF